MGELAEKLLEEMSCDTVFTIPVLGGIAISESVVVTWIIMAVILIVSLILTSNLKVHNVSKRQLVAEKIVTGLERFISNMVGAEGKHFVPCLATVLIFIGISNIIGLFGFKPPTKDLNVSAVLAIMSILLIQYAGISQKGPKKWLKSFAEPIAVIAPLNVMELFIKPLSLCMRLFGNVLAAFVIMELIKNIIPVALPVPFSLYFDIFDGLLQAYVFVFLTSLYIKEAVE